MANCVTEIAKLVKPVYESATEKTFPEQYNFSKFVSNYADDGFDIDGHLRSLKSLLNEGAGLGSLKIVPTVAHFLYEQKLQRRLNEATKCQVRMYMIEGFNFAKRDVFSESDPYLIIRCGKTEFNE